MLCRDFEKIAGDLAAGRLMEAVRREHALRHASECSACALRLNAERTLEAGLRALAEDAEDGEAPPHLKSTLRAAFDRQVKAAPPLTSAHARSRNLTRRWLALAALILFAVAIALLSRIAAPNSKEDMSGGGTPAPPSTPAMREQSPQLVIYPDNQKQKTGTYAVERSSAKRRTHRRAVAPDGGARNYETVTDYIPLTYLADATAMESGTVL
ncbi:MAG TPA: hypothetical protein VG324_29055, partial [Blastocatellia bacterium]|nr:hypothetical protein [Blastocatellia bacterium]